MLPTPRKHCGARLSAGLFEHPTRGARVIGEGVQDDVAAAEAGAVECRTPTPPADKAVVATADPGRVLSRVGGGL